MIRALPDWIVLCPYSTVRTDICQRKTDSTTYDITKAMIQPLRRNTYNDAFSCFGSFALTLSLSLFLSTFGFYWFVLCIYIRPHRMDPTTLLLRFHPVIAPLTIPTEHMCNFEYGVTGRGWVVCEWLRLQKSGIRWSRRRKQARERGWM